MKTNVEIVSESTPHKHDHQGNHEHEHTLYDELVCHFPYAVFSVAFGLAILSILTYISFTTKVDVVKKSSRMLFHSFHFMHIVFAATGTLVTFFRFSSNMVKALLVGIICPLVFCMLSDVILPYLGGRLLGVPMSFHICFISEARNVLPFLFVGIINGWVMSKHDGSKQGVYSLFSHVAHILVSSLASIFYLVSHGFSNWASSIGLVFSLLIVAVVVPCTLSDVVVPMLIAKMGKD